MKNKKLTFNALALGNLKHRKKQYTLLVLGIILSMVFSASVPFLISSALSSAEATKIYLYGSEDILIPNVSSYRNCEEHLEKTFSRVGYATVYGYLSNPKAESGTGVCIASFDEESRDMYISLKEGKLPQAENEIALEEEALFRMNLEAKVGDIITLDLFPKVGNEISKKSSKATFVITGILENKRQNIEKHTVLGVEDIPGAIVSQNYIIAAGGKESVMAFVSAEAFLDRKEYNEQFSAFLESYGDGNGHVLMYEISALANYDIIMKFTGLAAPGTLLVVLSVVFMFVADIGIINAFSASLKERKKQIGLLRSVGATKHQIIKIYGRESFILCLLCAPISVLISFGIISAIVPFLGENYVFKPEIWVVPVSIALSIIFVLIASFIPLVSASRISPMQAIRNTELGRKFKNKKIKTQKEFDTSRLLAKRNITLFRGKGVVTSIIVCVAVFVSLFGFSVVNALEDDLYTYDYDYTIMSGFYEYNGWFSNYKPRNRGLSENNLSEIILNENVEKISTQKITNAYVQTDEFTGYMQDLCYFNSQYNCDPENVWVTQENYKQHAQLSAEEMFVKKCAQIQDDVVQFELIGYDEETVKQLSEYVVAGKIDIDKLNSGEEVIVMVPDNILLTASHLEETTKYSYIHAYNTTLEKESYLAKEDIFLHQSACDFKVGQDISVGWLYAEDKPKFEGDIYHLAKDQKPISYEKLVTDTKIGSMLHGVPYKSRDSIIGELSFWGRARVITTTEGFDKLTNGNIQYNHVGVELNKECTEEINKEMNTLLSKVSAGTTGVVNSSYEKRQQELDDIRASLIIIIAVAALFFTACGSLVNNAITARIRESKREIGTLRAVGATQKDINNSYFRQIFSILGWGVLTGFVAFFIYYGLYYLVFISLGDSPNDYKVTIIETLVGVVLLFVSCTINMVVKIRKEMKNSIVENIREL